MRIKRQRKIKICPTCNLDFLPKTNSQRYCCPEHSLVRKRDSTEVQYKRISGNWDKFLNRLILSNKNRKHLKVEDLKNLLEVQDFKCALSGENLTCFLSTSKKFPTNVSIDKLDPSKGYELENIQLVCNIVNIMKWNSSKESFISWCKKVVKNNEKT